MIKEMLSGNDGKLSSGKVMKYLAFFVAVILCAVNIIFKIDLTGYVGMFLGVAAGQEIAQKVTNALHNNAVQGN